MRWKLIALLVCLTLMSASSLGRGVDSGPIDSEVRSSDPTPEIYRAKGRQVTIEPTSTPAKKSTKKKKPKAISQPIVDSEVRHAVDEQEAPFSPDRLEPDVAEHSTEIASHEIDEQKSKGADEVDRVQPVSGEGIDRVQTHSEVETRQSEAEQSETSLASKSTAIPLPRRGATKKTDAPAVERPTTANSAVLTGGSLALVLGVFLLFAFIYKRAHPRGTGLLPSEAVESLGRMPLSKAQHFQLLRIGGKLVLIVVSPHGAEPITEIVDPAEVDRLSSLCRQSSPSSVSLAFSQVLEQIGTESHEAGFLGETTKRTRRSTEARRVST